MGSVRAKGERVKQAVKSETITDGDAARSYLCSPGTRWEGRKEEEERDEVQQVDPYLARGLPGIDWKLTVLYFQNSKNHLKKGAMGPTWQLWRRHFFCRRSKSNNRSVVPDNFCAFFSFWSLADAPPLHPPLFPAKCFTMTLRLETGLKRGGNPSKTQANFALLKHLLSFVIWGESLSVQRIYFVHLLRRKLGERLKVQQVCCSLLYPSLVMNLFSRE